MMTKMHKDNIVRDVNTPAIYFRKLLQSSTAKSGKRKRCPRVYNAKHECPFCGKMFLKFAQHMLRVHANKREVQEINNIRLLPDDTDEIRKEKMKERKLKIDLIRLKANHNHNIKVLEKNKGEIMLGCRRNVEKFNVEAYGPCPRCFEWLRLTTIKRHQHSCPAAVAKMTKGELLVQSDIISGRLKAKTSKSILKEVFPIMREDKIGTTAKEDSLIVALENNWMILNIGNPIMRKYYTSSVMRLASRLKIELNKMITPENSDDLAAYLSPKYFEHVAKAALRVACQDVFDEEELGSPSNAIKLSFDIKRLVSIKLAQAIMNGDEEQKKQCNEFLQLMAISWTTKLATAVLLKRRLNARKPLPLPNDIENEIGSIHQQ